jgi:hypothetical protein
LQLRSDGSSSQCAPVGPSGAELLIAEADRDPNLIVGVDFAFSLPAWYLQERQLTPRQLWALLADEVLTPAMRQLGLTRWMNRPELPFWMTGEAHARLTPERMFRRTEQEVRVPGVQPKSVFQLVGAGQVGRGSLYGMGALHRLAGAGFRIWPFDLSGSPQVVEIFPRILTGPVRKNSPSERERYLGDDADASRPWPTGGGQRGCLRRRRLGGGHGRPGRRAADDL